MDIYYDEGKKGDVLFASKLGSKKNVFLLLGTLFTAIWFTSSPGKAC